MRIKQLLPILFLSLLLTVNIASAQVDLNSIWGTVSSILIQFSGIIFILIFILILLLVGGVIKLSSLGGGRFSLGTIIFIILLVLVFFIPQFITFPDYAIQVPPSFMYYPLPQAFMNFLPFIGLPSSWGYIPAIIYLFILPFAAIFTLVWAFITMIGIFQEKNINRVLAFIITFLTLPIGWFIKMVWALFAFMGIWSVAVFAATFIAGVFFRGAGAATKEYVSFEEVAGMAKKQRKELSRDLEKIKGETVAVMNPVIDAAIQAAAALGLSQSVVNTLKAARISNDPNQKRKYVEAAAKMIERGL